MAISARSGMIHYVEGRVFLGDQLIDTKFGQFPEIKEKGEMRTEDGRAEVLLTPGVFLRVGENSAIRMINNRLIDTRVEFVSGSAIVEADDILKDNAVAIVYKDYIVSLRKKGLYRFESDPAQVRVYDGEALVQLGEKSIEVKDGKMLSFGGDMAVAKFDNKEGDSLFRWTRRRAEYVSMANISAAKSLRDSDYGWSSSGWGWNPYFGMFTFIPYRGTYYSPFGFAFWSPFTVYRAYYVPTQYYAPSYTGGYNAGYGYNTMAQTSSGYSGTVASSAGSMHTGSSAASGAASSGISHGGGGASSGGGGAASSGGGGGGHSGHGR
jgi:hypothetical protein